jgi:hypothetical protein
LEGENLMPSRALQDFEDRLSDVQQLISAHDALTRLRRAESSLQTVGHELDNIAKVIKHLVTEPGAGRRREVHALNNAGIALLSGNLQGFTVDIFKESAAALLAGHVQSVEAVTEAARTRGNPNPQNIMNMFSTLGFEDIFDGLSWKRMSTTALKKKLQDFNTLRNQIVHGAERRVQKQVHHLNVFKNFATKLDAKLQKEIREVTGKRPW